MSVLQPLPSSSASISVEELRTVTAKSRRIHSLLQIVRSTYRAQSRKPQFEPAFVNWIEQFVRYYPTKPVGRLNELHKQAFLSHLASQSTLGPEKEARAREALDFFWTEVLRND